jgi:hypothetical protein
MEQESLDALLVEYSEACSSLSDQTRTRLLSLGSEFMEIAADYASHGEILIFVMETHCLIFSLAHENQEDFSFLANWWRQNQSEFIKLINTI